MCGDGDAVENTLGHDRREECLVSLLFFALPLSPHFGASSSSPIETRSSADCRTRMSRGQPVTWRRNDLLVSPVNQPCYL